MSNQRNILAGLAQDKNLSRSNFKNIVDELLEKKDFKRYSKYEKEGQKFLRENKNLEIVIYGEDLYPKLLKEIPDPPKYLFHKGNLEKVDFERSISIVGTRRITQYGQGVSYSIVKSLLNWDITTVSGFAYGVDQAVQLATLRTGGKTVAVLAEGIETWVNRNLNVYQKYKNDLVLISEYFPNQMAQKYHFPERNRVIAGLTSKTLVIEAPKKSGALITAKFALDYNREVLAIPHRIDSMNGMGCNELIKNSSAKLCTDIFDILGMEDQGHKNHIAKNFNVTESQIISIIKRNGFCSIGVIQKFLKIDIDVVLNALTTLESKGILNRSFENKYFVNSNLE